MYLRNSAILAFSVVLLCLSAPTVFHQPGQASETAKMTYEDSIKDFLKDRLYTKEQLDEWLRPKEDSFSQYDPLVGYQMHNRQLKEGIDGSNVTYHYDENGARQMINYADKPCRINTYGSSFTDCEQVNDGESWQERLAAHIGEPVRNYGVGGQTVYQSYLRMQREHKVTPTDYIIVNVTPPYERQMYGWQAFFYTKSAKHPCPPMPCVRVNSKTGKFEERPNPCPTAESLYNCCDFDWVYDTFKDDFTLHIRLAEDNIKKGRPELSYEPMMKMAADRGMQAKIETPEKLREVANALFIQESVYATVRILEKIDKFAKANGIGVLYILTYASTVIEETLKSGKRFDQDVIDFLDKKGLPYVDILDALIQDFGDYSISFDEYQKMHYVGHVSPMGNFFVAYKIKDKMIELMDPKPAPYR